MNIQTTDYHAAFDYLLDRANGRDRAMPTIDGKKPHDLQDFLKLMPRDEPLSSAHQRAVESMFMKKQAGYFRTAWNLFHRVRQMDTVKRKTEAMKRVVEKAFK